MNPVRVVRNILVGLAVVAAFVLAVSLGLRWYGSYRFEKAVAEFERAFGPLDVKRFEKPDVPDRDNAAIWIEHGMGAVVFLDDDRKLVSDAAQDSDPHWTPTERERLQTVVDRNSPAFELLDRARGAGASSWNLRYGRGTELKLPNLLEAMHAARLLVVRARLARDRGDVETAVRSAETLGAMARSLESEPHLILVLVGSAIERFEIQLIQDFVADPGTRSTALNRLAESLSQVDLVDEFHRSLLNETGAILRAQRNAIASGVPLSTNTGERPGFDPTFTRLSLEQLVESWALDTRRRAIERLGGPVVRPLAPPPSFDGRIRWWKPPVDSYGPNIADASARMVGTLAARDLARIAIALRLEAAGSGRYPPTLPPVPGVGETDPLTGGPRAYNVRGDGSAEVRCPTTPDVVRSIFPVGANSYRLYGWSLPAVATSSRGG